MDFQEFMEAVSKSVSMSDLLSEYGTQLQTPMVEEQISCPFHGKDRHPSARHYPETNSIYCFTCKKSWDPFHFLMEKKGLRFMEAIDYIGKKYSIETSGMAYQSDGSRRVKFQKPGAKEQKKELSLEEQMMIARGAIEGKILRCRGKVPAKKYMDLVYLMSHMWGMDTEEKFLPVAFKVNAAVDKILNAEVSENG